MSTQKTVYEWLMSNPGEHTNPDVAAGTGLDRVQTSNALTNLKRKDAVASGHNGSDYTWFAIPGAKTHGTRDGGGVQKTVYDWLLANPGGHLVSAIADGTGLASDQAGSACRLLSHKGATIKEGRSQNTLWTAVPNANLGERATSSVGHHRGASPGVLAKLKFDKALELLIDAAVELKDFVVPEDVSKELEELRAFKATVEREFRAMRGR